MDPPSPAVNASPNRVRPRKSARSHFAMENSLGPVDPQDEGQLPPMHVRKTDQNRHLHQGNLQQTSPSTCCSRQDSDSCWLNILLM